MRGGFIQVFAETMRKFFYGISSPEATMNGGKLSHEIKEQRHSLSNVEDSFVHRLDAFELSSCLFNCKCALKFISEAVHSMSQNFSAFVFS